MNQNSIVEISVSNIDKQVDHLLSLKSNSAKEKLLTSHTTIAEHYLSELFRGNGWTVSKYGDKKKALFLSDPKRPDIILLMVRFISDETELTYAHAREELIMFENVIGPLYGCSQFCLIAINGYEAKAEQLEKFNLLLQDWSYIDDLLEHYSKDKVQEPRIQLFAHNKQTYKKVQKMMQQNKSVAVVQATGTGKSYLISKMLQDFTGEKRLVMAPSLYVIEQVKEHILWDKENIEFMTYAKSMYLTQSEIAQLQPKLIVLDEFHRCGADEWGRGVDNILNAYPEAFKFGTSATPIRYMDNARDMSNELFNGNVAENLGLAQAIVRNILPMPKYICALYTIAEETNELKDRIVSSGKSAERKKQLLLDLDTFAIDWERSRGIASVLKKHLQKKMNKFIVFCRDEEHLLEMEPVVKKWFKEATDNFPVKTYRVYDNEPNSDKQLEAFKQDTSKDHIHLLFSINMLNEGVHVSDVHGVILLRPTESPNIFYQQIGRCLKVGLNHQPVIFDFVNNFKSIHAHEFLYNLEFERKNYLDTRNEHQLGDRCPKFAVHDEVREITEVFGEIKFQLENWHLMYERLTYFYKKNRHTRPARESCSDQKLITWTVAQRMRYKKEFMNEEQVSLLCAIDFQWDVYEAQWETNFEKLLEFKNTHGHCFVPQKRKEFKALAYWVSDARMDYKHGKLSPEKIQRFEEIGFSWNAKEDDWLRRYSELKDFLKNNDWDNLIENKKIWKWVHTQRNHYRKKKMKEKKIMLMNELGIDWTPLVNKWLAKYNELLKYKEQYGNVSVGKNSVPYHSLRLWLTNQRTNYKKKILSEEQVKKLEDAGFELVFRKKADETWNKYCAMALEFYKRNGHAVVPVKVNKQLANWLDGNRLPENKRSLTAEQLRKLNEIGYDWSTLEKKQEAWWMSAYNEVRLFKKTFGHCDVPQGNNEYVKLARWCSSQRMNNKNGILREDRKRLLDLIGFSWTVKAGRKS